MRVSLPSNHAEAVTALISESPMINLPLLSRIEIATPCPTTWEPMNGDDRVRYCGICEKNVYNFSAMTAAEVEGLVREKEGRLCARFYQRADGTMLTADCPTGIPQPARWKKPLAGVAAALSSLMLSGCLAESEPNGTSTLNPPAQQVPPESNPKECVGKLAPVNLPQALLGDVYVRPVNEKPPAQPEVPPQPGSVE